MVRGKGNVEGKIGVHIFGSYQLLNRFFFFFFFLSSWHMEVPRLRVELEL